MLLVLVMNSGIPRETLAEESFPKVFWASMIRGLDFFCLPSLGNFYVVISESSVVPSSPDGSIRVLVNFYF